MQSHATSLLVLAISMATVSAGTLMGNLRDLNWYARRGGSDPFGVGYYEFAVNGNSASSTSPGAAASTGIFGEFSTSVPAGTYTVASWDVWWRSAYAFGVAVPSSGSSPVVDLRLHATMWGYPAFWDEAGHTEFGQTFRATGPVTMIYFRSPANAAYVVSVHEQGPGGKQVGVSRNIAGTGDMRLIYGYGDMPTSAGAVYYLRIRSSGALGVIRQMDPRPDFSDPMPEGCLYMGNLSGVTAYPDRDLGVIIMCDDDGLLTNVFTRHDGANSGGARIGQSFVARGVNLISAAFWVADSAAPTYLVALYEGSPESGLTQIGPSKRGKPARVTADPEMLVTWAPGECPLNPGQNYYIELVRADGAQVNVALRNSTNPYKFGQAYVNGNAVSGSDFAVTLMEEESARSATEPAIQFTVQPKILESERGANRLLIRWSTDIPSDSHLEIAEGNPPYTRSLSDSNLVTEHAVEVTGLRSDTMHHFRARSEAENVRAAISRDMVICTRNRTPNVLLNPGFEEGAGASPRKTIAGWTTSGSVDLRSSDGTWFSNIKPHSGKWLLEGAVNGSASDGAVFQRVAATPGKDYTFSAWLGTWMQENGGYKYDVWNNEGRLIYMRLGIDPTGGLNPGSSTVQWTPRMYSHLHYSNIAKTAVARANQITVFISMKGQGGEWHLYGVDDCIVTETEPRPVAAPLLTGARGSETEFQLEVYAEAGASILIESSLDLRAWNSFTNFIAGDKPTLVKDSLSGAGRFFRASAEPQ
jgi:hypothetical protein